MSSTCAPISTPGGGTAKVRSSNFSSFCRSSMTGSGSRDFILGQNLVQSLYLRRAVDHDRDRAFALFRLIGLDTLWDLILVVDLDGFVPLVPNPRPSRFRS